MALTTILVGCDLSPGSDVALERAIAIAAPHGATVVLVHAQAEDAPPAEIDHVMQEQLGEVSALVRARDARELADRMAHVEARGVAAQLISRNGPPEEVLAQAAAERQAELIAIGSQGHTGIARMLLGSVASSTIRHATCDVLVCRGPVAAARFGRPLVATDFSPVSAKVLEHAALLAEPGAPFDLVHAWQLPTGSWGATLLGQARFPWSTVRDAVLASARSLADKLVTDHQGLGHPLHVALEQGAPAQVITQAAERGSNDLIAVGAHGRRGVRRLLLGSVAESTIRHSPCSVLVVHGDPKP
ncbi:MAG TPA: universal stress protein [Kofleriaceae bacterium]|nr:universal stress protein [Kofleriaceae bacterium]